MANNKGKSSGDPITRWLVIGMVALVVVVGAGITIFLIIRARKLP